MLRFRGSQSFRTRLVCATIAGKPIRIDDIRTDDESPGAAPARGPLIEFAGWLACRLLLAGWHCCCWRWCGTADA